MASVARLPDEEVDLLLAEATRVRATGALGRSSRIQDLFDLLVDATAANRRLKEFDVACEVFGRDAGFDPALDASVRVHVHRLRRKLDDHYRTLAHAPLRLDVPRGEYRIALIHAEAAAEPAPPHDGEEVPAEAATPAVPPAPAATRRRGYVTWIAATGWAVATALLIAMLLRPDADNAEDARLASLTRTALWSEFAASPRGKMLVLESAQPQPAEDGTPASGLGPRATLPLAAAPALRDVLPLVHHVAPTRRYAMVVPTARLQPEATRSESFIYLGFLAGLQRTFPSLLGASRYAIDAETGSVFDRTARRWFRATTPVGEDKVHREHALLIAADGPTGNRVVVVAGTGNAALNEAARTASDTAQMERLTELTKGARNIEALYEVRGDGDLGLGISLISASPRRPLDWGRQAGRTPAI